MCLVCVDLVKQNMTVVEAEANLRELAWVTKNKRQERHYRDLYEALQDMDEEILETYFNRNEDGV